MSLRMGLLGKKVGMTQMFDEKGVWSALTVVEMKPSVIVDIKTKEKHGYSAICLGFDDKPAKRVNRPLAGVFAKAKSTPKRVIRELRLTAEETAQFTVGQSVAPAEVFSDGDIVDIVAKSRGKGFQGVMKLHNMAGFPMTHGTHEYRRHGGSVGCRLTPGRTFKGKRMPAHMGDKQTTVQNVRISKVLADKNLVLLKGAVPGAPDGYVLLKHAIKALSGPFTLKTATAPAAEAQSA